MYYYTVIRVAIAYAREYLRKPLTTAPFRRCPLSACSRRIQPGGGGAIPRAGEVGFMGLQNVEVFGVVVTPHQYLAAALACGT